MTTDTIGQRLSRVSSWLSAALANPSKGRRVDLDVVRGIAIMLAMGWHFSRPTNSMIANFIFWPGRSFGWAGVDLFFVLSGFLVGSLIFTEIQKTGRLDIKWFFVRRMFKLWPTLYVFLALFLLWEPWQKFFLQIGFHVQNYFRTPVATHLWSLAVEEHFYLIFAFVIPIYFSKIKSPIGFGALMVGLMILAFALRIVAFLAGVPPETIQAQTQYRIDALAMGVLLATISCYYPAAFERLLSLKCLWAAVLLVGAIFLAHYPKGSAIGCTIGFTVSYLTSAATLLLIHKSGIEKRLPWLCNPLAKAGVYSYAIYIWHVPAAKLMDRFVAGASVNNNAIVLQLLNYATAITAGILMTRALEKPCLALRDRLFPRDQSYHIN